MHHTFVTALIGHLHSNTSPSVHLYKKKKTNIATLEIVMPAPADAGLNLDNKC
jgi:hypothetical protein